MQNNLIVGLTGGFASGKTTVSNYLKDLGAFVVDADIIARQVVAPNSSVNLAIKKLLGDDFLLDSGELDRNKIKELIFNNKQLKQKYESIIFPEIRKQLLLQVESPVSNSCYTVISAPLLFENGLDKYTSYNIVVDVPEDIQLQRALARDNISKDMIYKIISTQMSREMRNSRANFIISNVENVTYLYLQLDRIHDQLKKLATTHQKNYPN